ncbi:hypothetical protein DBV15_01832 [Temnothorax longispinosus]|uniref:Uncharacterized protein n=1 Tax=Temnothorax longispinosus TaxID=300112 RepID=A0A4S2L073_9HYME|nr:hypothetical protein DBV15_01832 [Temnothorax longispinosus]
MLVALKNLDVRMSRYAPSRRQFQLGTRGRPWPGSVEHVPSTFPVDSRLTSSLTAIRWLSRRLLQAFRETYIIGGEIIHVRSARDGDNSFAFRSPQEWNRNIRVIKIGGPPRLSRQLRPANSVFLLNSAILHVSRVGCLASFRNRNANVCTRRRRRRRCVPTRREKREKREIGSTEGEEGGHRAQDRRKREKVNRGKDPSSLSLSVHAYTRHARALSIDAIHAMTSERIPGRLND